MSAPGQSTLVAAAQAGMQPLRCLVVDDERFARVTLRGLLEGLGHTVHEASDGAAALAASAAVRPDMVFLDLGLPDMDGERVLEQLVAVRPDIVVIVVSGKKELSAPISAFRKGACDYIPKNALTAESLRLAIRHCLERCALEYSLAAAKDRHRRLIENVPLVIFALNEQLELTFVSRASAQVFGLPPERILAEPGWFMDGVRNEDRAVVRETLTRAFASESTEPVSCEFRFLGEGAAPLYLQLRGSVSGAGGGTPRQMEGALLDLSERVFLERVLVQREKLNTLAALVDEIAHEFRNPVFALAGFARALQRKYPEAQEAAVLLEEARRLETMIARVQEYLVPVEVKWASCRLDEVVGFAANIMRHALARREIGLELHMEKLPPIESDINILTQIVVGMFSLAEEWGKPGSAVQVHCRNLVKGLLLNVVLEAPDVAMHEPELPLIPFAGGGKPQPLVLSYKLARALGCLLSLRAERGTLIITLLMPLAAQARDPEEVDKKTREQAGAY